MDDLGFNKIAAAVLATALGIMLIKEAPHKFMHVEKLKAPAYALEMPEMNKGAEAAVDLPFPQASFVNAMDATKGAKVFKKCTSCHNAAEGGANGTGPNIWDIVDKPAGAVTGFNYSSAMAGSGITWDYESLNGFLTKPSKYLSGTNMNFVGLKKEEDRAALIAYLREQAPAPRPLPVAKTAPVEGELEAAVEDVDGVQEIIVTEEGHAENHKAAEGNLDLVKEEVQNAAEKANKPDLDAVKDKVKEHVGGH